jgi:hypothetical protein
MISGIASSLPVPDLWKDVLLNDPDTIINSNAIAPRLMKSHPSVSTVRTSLSSLESSALPYTVHRWLERVAFVKTG